jgi:hypothetical protein
LIAGVPEPTLVGGLIRGGPPQSASAVEIGRYIQECPHDQVAVEEQDKRFYIIHIRNAPNIWVVVNSESPIFTELRERHSRWMAEHPGWNGWIAF